MTQQTDTMEGKKIKIIPNIRVKDMEFIDGNGNREIYKRNGAIMSNGQVNDYRVAFIKGQGGSCKETTWNKEKHHHNCCKSRVAWRHKTGCPLLNKEF
jgi:hypothetical protein